jgi:hypothetical protein
MLNTNDYKTGYEHGIEDARKDKDKCYRFKGLSWKYWINSDNASRTYIQGYDNGYLDGIRERNSVYDSQKFNNNTPINRNILITNKSNSMSVQKLELQLQKLQEMENFLGQLQNQFQQNIKTYNDKMLLLRQSGMPLEICDTYDQKYQMPKIQTMQKTMQEINQQDIPYIKKNIGAIERAIIVAK